MTLMRWSLTLAIYAAVLIFGWWALVHAFSIPAYLLPEPGAVAARLWLSLDLFLHHGSITALEIVLSLLLGTTIGFATGVACWRSAWVENSLLPVLVLTQALPVFAIAPVLVTWLGYGLAPKLVMATLIVFFPVALSTLHGLKRVPRGWLDQAAVMRATPFNRFWWIMLPAALGTIAVGIRLAAVSAPIGAIVGEWVGSAEGLGFLMLRANQRVEIDTVFAALFVLFMLTLAIYGACACPNRALTSMGANQRGTIVMTRRLAIVLFALVLLAPIRASAEDKLTILLDWFVNPDHAPLIIAREHGHFAKAGLDVNLIAPTDPNDPPKLVAAGRADLAISSQPQLHLQVQARTAATPHRNACGDPAQLPGGAQGWPDQVCGGS